MFHNIFQNIINFYINKKKSKIYYIFFSISKFFLKENFVVPFKNYRFYSSTKKKDLSRWMLKHLEEWDKDKISKIKNLIKKENASFIDCGCNYGAYSIPIAKKFPYMDIYAFDASKKIISRLIDNIDLNKIKNIKYFNIGIGEKNEKKYFNENINYYNNSGSFKFEKKKEINTNKVNIYSLDSLAKKKIIKLKKNVIIKLDIEGYEFFALKGMKEIIKKHKVIVFFEVSKMIIENNKNVVKHFDIFIKKNKLSLYNLNFKKKNITKVFQILNKTDSRYQTIDDYILANIKL